MLEQDRIGPGARALLRGPGFFVFFYHVINTPPFFKNFLNFLGFFIFFVFVNVVTWLRLTC